MRYVNTTLRSVTKGGVKNLSKTALGLRYFLTALGLWLCIAYMAAVCPVDILTQWRHGCRANNGCHILI